MSMESRLQVIEMAQMEVANALEDMKMSLEDIRAKHNTLLDERSQAINLAKIICPTYDATNEYWQIVHKLSTDIEEVKKEKDELQKKKDVMSQQNHEKTLLPTNFLKSVTKGNRKKRQSSASITTSSSPMSPITEDGDTTKDNDSRPTNLFGENDRDVFVEQV